MPAITYSDFSGGLDRRLPINVQEASRLWTLQNAFITNGKKIKKRPALHALTSGLTGTFGLKAFAGVLRVFSTRSATPPSPPAQVGLVQLDFPSVYDPLYTSLAGIQYVDVFQGFAYVVARYSTSPSSTITYRHHYVDGSANTNITDANCPHTLSVTKAVSRVFAINGESVRYTAAGNARDWTTAGDAGFLPTTLHLDAKSSATAVGTFQGALVTFFEEAAQIWKVAVDPSANEWTKNVKGVGTKAPGTLAEFASDLAFLSPYGVRSMTVQTVNDSIQDTDVGVAIDSLVVPSIPTDQTTAFGIWLHQLGQYWLVFPGATTTTVYAYTFSRSSKVACWSLYSFPIVFQAIETMSGKVYVRSTDVLYELLDTQYTDDGTAVAVEAQLAFQNAKTPGVEKQWSGADFVMSGTAAVSYKFDPRDTTKETISQSVSGDTQPGVVVPVEVVCAAIAPVVRHSANEAFELTQLTLYHLPLLVT